jgi:hypothetical protein
MLNDFQHIPISTCARTWCTSCSQKKMGYRVHKGLNSKVFAKIQNPVKLNTQKKQFMTSEW